MMFSKQVGSWTTFAAICLFAGKLCSQPSPPPHGPPRPGPPHGPAQDKPQIERRIEEIQKRLAADSTGSTINRELKKYVQLYLQDTDQALGKSDIFRAERFVEAADACRRPLDHLAHLENKKAPSPPANTPDDLRRVYFRLQLCSFFLEQIPNPKPTRLLQLAETFYQQAVKARDSEQNAAAGEYARAADDLTHALENLAQAYAPQSPPAPLLPKP